MFSADRIRKAGNLLAGHIDSIQIFRADPELAAIARRIAEAGVSALIPPVVFRHVAEIDGRDVFEIGREGQEVRQIQADVRGVWWVWRAIDTSHQADNTLRAIDLAGPDSAEPVAAARKAIRKTAAQWLGRHMPELEAAAMAISIEGGTIRYLPAANAPRIVTR